MSSFEQNVKSPRGSGGRRRNEWLIVGAVLMALSVVLAIAAWNVFTEPAEPLATDVRPQATGVPAAVRPENEPAPAEVVESNQVDDDGATLWASPTDGPPLELAYLPPGVQIVLALRPKELLAHPEGEKVVAALGPLGAAAITWMEQVAGLPLREVDRLLVGWQVTSEGNWQPALVISSDSPISPAALANAKRRERAGAEYFVAGDLAYHQPAHQSNRLLIIASPTAMEEILDLGGNPPPLRRDIERLLRGSDSLQHATLVFAPNLLSSAGRDIFTGSLSQLRRPLNRFLGDGPSAAMLSMHWDVNFFAELSVVPTLDVPADRLVATLAERVAALPEQVEDFVVVLSPTPYGRRVVARFPEMVRKLAAHTRHGVDDDRATLRCYLPAAAGHNLLMGAELALAEGWGGRIPSAAPVADASQAMSVSERLTERTSLRFTRDTLEAALKLLSQDIGVQIIIRGPDLQSEGITKNQSFGIDISDRPAEEILVEILRLANPDKLATGPSDPRQKLVYVVGPKSISVTTRAKAVERGDALPPAFLPGG